MFRPTRRFLPFWGQPPFGSAHLAAVLVALCLADVAAAQAPIVVAEPDVSADTLYQETFGPTPTARSISIALEVLIDEKTIGLVTTRLPPRRGGGDACPQAANVLKALEEVLQESVYAQLPAMKGDDGCLPLSALQSAGLEAKYDPSRLVLAIRTPPNLRRTRTASLSDRRRAARPSSEVVPSSPVSGMVNLRLAQDFRFTASTDTAGARQPLRLGVEGAINVLGWVLEGRGELSEQAPTLWSRGDVRLVRDDTVNAVRYVAGDITTPSTLAFQSGRPLLGVSAARNFSLDPDRQVLPEEAVSFLLERPSRVEVFVNGRLVRTLQLEAGPQDLKGLLLDLGENALELVITDDLGAQQRVTKRVGLATGQLAAGVSEFAYTVGVPVQTGLSGRTQDWNRPTLNLVHRQGISGALTLGGVVQADPETQQLGFEQLWSTILGSVSATGAVSHHRALVGYAAGLRYQLRRPFLGSDRYGTLGIGGEYRTSGFTQPGVLPATEDAYVLRAFHDQSFGGGYFARLSAEVRAQGPGLERAYSGTIALTRSFQNGLMVMLDGTAQRDTENLNELRGRLNLVWTWPGARRTVFASTEAGTRVGPSTQLSANQQFIAATSIVNASAGVSQDEQTRRTTESVSWRGQRGEVEISHRLLAPLSQPGALDNAVQARAGVALVFADGVFALSRPVTRSFAIVTPNAALRGQQVRVNPTAEGFAAVADGLGPAVLDVQPYFSSNLRVDAPNLPVGYSLGADAHTVRPMYRGGTVVRVGEAGSVLLRGVLRDEAGAPVQLTAGVVERLSDDAGSPIPFFTNRTGRFVLPAMRPGQYALRVDDDAPAVRFTIPEGSVGVFELEQVRIAIRGGGSSTELVAKPDAGAASVASHRNVRGRLFGDRNANRTWDADEPVFAGVKVAAGTSTASTNAEGLFELKDVTGAEAVLRVQDVDALPFGAVPAEQRVALVAPDVTADLLVPAARFPLAPNGPFEVLLPEGRVRVLQLEKASFPLASWVAALPLSPAEVRRLERLAQRVHEGKQMRLLIVAHAQTQGSLRSSVKRAFSGAKALQRYLKATQFVPGSKVAATVLEALPGMENPMGRIELVLVHVEGPVAP